MGGDLRLITAGQVQTDVIYKRDMKQNFPSPPQLSSSVRGSRSFLLGPLQWTSEAESDLGLQAS